MQTWTADGNERLDAFLSKDSRMLSRAKAQAAIEDGQMTVNGSVQTKVAFRLKIGDTVEWSEPDAVPSAFEPVDLHLKVLYEDDACIVIQKPAGYAVHPGAGMDPNEKTILHGLAFLFAERGLPFSENASLAHRLDKETTGCLLVGKNAAAHIALQKQFENRTVRKFYLAIVSGVPEHTMATIDSPIGRSRSDRTKMGVIGVSRARESKTTYRMIQEAPAHDAALLECDLHTGRTHQVRVHLHSIGHPVLGDPNYRTHQGDQLAQHYDITGLCLHAWRLTFVSPATGKEQTTVAEPSEVFQGVLNRMGMDEIPNTKSQIPKKRGKKVIKK